MRKIPPLKEIMIPPGIFNEVTMQI